MLNKLSCTCNKNVTLKKYIKHSNRLISTCIKNKRGNYEREQKTIFMGEKQILRKYNNSVCVNVHFFINCYVYQC